jgi:ABC-type Mn2+/Zn2+ transport system ATPase subunit
VPLRLLVILGSKTDKVCVLDESYKQVNPERVELVSQFIKQVSEELGLQIVMMSHHESMRSSVDRAFWLADDGEKTVLRKG